MRGNWNGAMPKRAQTESKLILFQSPVFWATLRLKHCDANGFVVKPLPFQFSWGGEDYRLVRVVAGTETWELQLRRGWRRRMERHVDAPSAEQIERAERAYARQSERPAILVSH